MWLPFSYSYFSSRLYLFLFFLLPPPALFVPSLQPTLFFHLLSYALFLFFALFLLHGYYNYGHVMIDESGEEPRLGVPGNYYEREQMVAEMFGFPVFEPAREGEHITNGTFGYFYTRLPFFFSALITGGALISPAPHICP